MDPLRNLSASEGESTRWSGSALPKRKRYPSKTSRLILPVDSADGVVRKVGQTPRRKLKLKGGGQPSRLEVNNYRSFTLTKSRNQTNRESLKTFSSSGQGLVLFCLFPPDLCKLSLLSILVVRFFGHDT